jgi:hypothetical protein
MAKKMRSTTRTKKRPVTSDPRINRAVKKLEQFYRLGQKVLKNDDANPRKQIHSPGVIVDMVDEVGMSGDYIHKARNFAATYTPEQFQELIELRRPDGMPLGRRHIIMLMRIKDKRRRNRYQRLAADKGWSINQIAAEVSKLFKQPGGAGGRKPQRAVDVDGALMQIVKMTDHWGRWYDAYVPKRETSKKSESKNEQVVLSDLPPAVQQQLKSVTQQINALKAKAERKLKEMRQQ